MKNTNSNPRLYLLARTQQQADLSFYERYDPLFLFRKVDLLHFVYRNSQAVLKLAEDLGSGSSAISEADLRGYVAEMHCSMIHQFEALFALMLASVQGLPHWLYLTVYKTADIRSHITNFVNGDIGAVTGGLFSSREDFVCFAIYPGVDKDKAPPEFQESVRDISWFLAQAGEIFLGAQEYNAYKHGLRVVPGAVQLSVDIGGTANPGTFKPILSMKHSVTYLAIVEENEGKGVYEITKEISLDESYQLVLIMSKLAETIQTIRIAGIKKETVEVPTFKIDRTGLSRLCARQQMKMSF